MSKILKCIPGYRSQKGWKIAIASIYYMLAILISLIAESFGFMLMLLSVPFILFGFASLVKRKGARIFVIGIAAFFVGIMILGFSDDSRLPSSDEPAATAEAVAASPTAEPTPDLATEAPATDLITEQPISESDKITMEDINRIAQERNDYILSCDAVTYDNLARRPEYYKGKRVGLQGKVSQIISEEGLDVLLRVSVTIENADFDFWTDDISVRYTKESTDEARILEDDIINIYGVSEGLKTYELNIGDSTVSMPHIYAKYIE